MKLTVACSPHIRGDFRSSRLMLDVMLALTPALLVGVWMHGIRSALVVLTSIASCVVFEWLYSRITKKRNTIIDGSAMVTDMLLAMTLPATVPYWLVLVGSGLPSFWSRPSAAAWVRTSSTPLCLPVASC